MVEIGREDSLSPESAPLTAASEPPSPQLEPHPRLDWRPVLLEAFFVVLGVVLALAANEWRQAWADEQQATTALDAIREELEENRQAVAQSLDYHLTLSDTLRAFAMRPDPSGALPGRRVFSRGFISPASVLSTAWETATATDAISHMPYETVVLLNRAYEQQQHYEFQADQVGQVIYTKLFNEGYEAILRNYLNLSTIIGTFWYRECQLLSTYDQTLATLGGDAAPDASALPPACGYVLGERGAGG